MAEYKDYVSANGGIEGQVTPTYSTPGALTTAAAVTAQVTTQSNPFPGINAAINTGLLAVTPQTYSSPGGKAGAL